MENRLTLGTETEELINMAPVFVRPMARKKIEKPSSIFTYFAKKKADTDFVKNLTWKFGEETAGQVLEAFGKINLPAPTRGTQFLKSNEGSLVFLNKYNVVVRVEPQTPEKNYYARVNDSGCVLQPLASIDAGKAVVEICSGCNVEKDEASIEQMKELLKDEGLIFSDPQLENLGRMHTDNPKFPKGVLLILDRLAVSKMKEDVKIVKNSLSEDAKKEQERIFAPFRKAFREGLLDNSKMNRFWDLCETYASEGKFMAGWNDNSEFFDKIGYLSKTSRAEEVAKSYSRILTKFEKRQTKLQTKSQARYNALAKSQKIIHVVIASEAKQSLSARLYNRLLRRFAPRKDGNGLFANASDMKG